MKPRLIDNATIEDAVRIEQPRLGALDSIDFPVQVALPPKPVREEVLDASEGLDNLTAKALRKAEEILDMNLTPGDEDFNAILKAQVSQVQTILTTQARVDEGRFKKKQADKLGELLDLIKGEEARLVTARVLN
jgi:hypothetical protein